MVLRMADSLLIIEDEALLGQELARHYRRAGWEVVLAQDLRRARRLLLDEGLDPLVVLSDMSLPDGNALDLLEQVSGKGRIGEIESFAGKSTAAQAVREMLARLSQVPFSALIICGETGTGKGLAARILHHSGPRAERPLVELNCAAFPRELLEAELFGYEAGAFTGAKGRHQGLLEQAHGGTVFLDEIGELSLDLQAKLLKAIEDKCFRRLGGEREISWMSSSLRRATAIWRRRPERASFAAICIIASASSD